MLKRNANLVFLLALRSIIQLFLKVRVLYVSVVMVLGVMTHKIWMLSKNMNLIFMLFWKSVLNLP